MIRIICLFALWLGTLSVQAQEATFKGTVEPLSEDTVSIFLYRGDAYGREWLGPPLDTLLTTEKHFELSPDPGAYTVVVERKQHNNLVFPLLLPPNATEEAQFVLTSETADSAATETSSSSVSWSETSNNPAYQSLRDSLLVFEQKQRTLIPLAVQGEADEAQLTAYWNRLDAVLEQYAGRFPQIVAENRIINLRYLHPAMAQAFRLDETSADATAYDSLFRSGGFDDFMTQFLQAVEMLDPASYLATPDAVSLLVGLDEYLSQSAYLRKTYDLRKYHFHWYVLNYVDAVSDEEIGADILFRTSYEYLRRPDGATKGVEVLAKLKQQYPNSYYVQEGAVDTQLTGMRMTVGKTAPAFAVQTLAGDSLTLADLAGKYVYLDFWGSWCGPCIKELPNLKALAAAFSEDQLRVVGLAEDREKSLRAFLEKQPLPYPNALAPQAVRAYGITSFPTTFLISPNGVILAKNLRGDNLPQLVEEAIQAHEATAAENMEGDSSQ